MIKIVYKNKKKMNGCLNFMTGDIMYPQLVISFVNIYYTHTQDLKKKCFLDTEDPTLYTHLHSYSYKPSIYTEFSSDS